MILDKETTVRSAVEALKKSEFGATAIKIELEGQLNRRNQGDDNAPRDENGVCTECESGRLTCRECEGEYQGARGDCDYCEVGCDDCNAGMVDCYECDQGTVTCRDCRGVYRIRPGETRRYNFSQEYVCYNFIMERLVEHGLAKRIPDNRMLKMLRGQLPSNSGADNYGVRAEYEPTGALKYAKFYLDGSVDSEFTATVSLDKPENVNALVKLIEAWNAFVEANGGICDTRGAGMHMALIRDKDCKYPSSRGTDDPYLSNFSKSMQLLIPALYFLGSSSESSRSMRYRRPDIGNGNHRSAIDWRNGALEYRLFETCYSNPEQVLDNVVVMANTIKYWSKKYKPSGLEKITTSIRFGTDGGNTVQRFYTTTTHLDLLNRGLEKLKPAHRTIRELKEQRGFKLTKKEFNSVDKKYRKQAELEYKAYEESWAWQMTCYLKRREWDIMSSTITPKSEEERLKAEAKARETAEKDLETEKKRKTPIERFIQERIAALSGQRQGDYTLAV